VTLRKSAPYRNSLTYLLTYLIVMLRTTELMLWHSRSLPLPPVYPAPPPSRSFAKEAGGSLEYCEHPHGLREGTVANNCGVFSSLRFFIRCAF